MKLYVLRHGQTAYNEKNLIQGTTDVPLSEEGIRQAARAGKRIEGSGLFFDRVYSSPIEVGALAGRSTLEDTEIMNSFMHFPDRYVPLPGGESFPDLVKRAGSFLEWLRKEDLPGSTLVCTHGGWMHAMRMYLEPGPMRDFWKPPITNCTMFVLDRDREDRWKITGIIENTEGRALGF